MPSRQRGFTLIEILVAVAIVAIAMGAIIAGMARFVDNAAYLREKTIAVWVAHDRLAELELQREWPDVGKSNGETEMAGASWKWELEVQKTGDEHLRRVDVRVLAPEAAHGKTSAAREAALVKLSAFLADSGRK
ncbi:type II secretion system minor pseudopilin GspI [Solimonas terrae]|uniref:Type II secretion system protein I n=1 Tax=Solimonas terrae TaxID=1396819 RepID=A0A6M2BVB9_9GAMM|nr:type II secretion system minor pseudopilin GspI [Solimonas terrae]